MTRYALIFAWMIGLLVSQANADVRRATPASADRTSAPNVLFVMADDLNCNLGCYGHPLVQSPNLDRLARRGLRFENAYCQFPLCGPSRAALMCGLYPDQTLIHKNAIRIRKHLPDVQTLPQAFQARGFTATRVGKIFHYNVPNDIGTPGHDDPSSWNVTFNPRGRDKDDEPRIFSLQPGHFGATLSWLADEGDAKEQTDGVGASEAIKLLEAYAAKKTPFFLAVGFYRPHTPYVSPKKFFDLYPVERIHVPTIPAGYLKSLPAPARASVTAKKEQIHLPVETARQAMRAYYAAISLMDAQVGRLLDALDRLGLAQSTIIVFVSDHGYHMGEHGHYQKRTLFEEGTRVPLIISVPGMKTAGQTTQSPAETIDLYPTLVELCGLSRPAHISGVSLASVLADPSAKPRAEALTQFDTGYSLRTPRYRYTEWGHAGRDGVELYDHESDPQEMTNLANRADQAEIRTRLSETLRERIRSARRAPAGLTQINKQRS